MAKIPSTPKFAFNRSDIFLFSEEPSLQELKLEKAFSKEKIKKTFSDENSLNFQSLKNIHFDQVSSFTNSCFDEVLMSKSIIGLIEIYESWCKTNKSSEGKKRVDVVFALVKNVLTQALSSDFQEFEENFFCSSEKLEIFKKEAKNFFSKKIEFLSFSKLWEYLKEKLEKTLKNSEKQQFFIENMKEKLEKLKKELKNIKGVIELIDMPNSPKLL